MPTTTHRVHDASDPATYLNARASLAKLGVNLDAIGDFNDASTRDLLNLRNDLRRSLSTLNDRARAQIDAGDNAAAERTVDEIDSIKAILDRTQRQLDNQAVLSDVESGDGEFVTVNGQRTRILRNIADIRRHYASQNSGGRQSMASPMQSSGDMTLADFMRGVANLPTTADVRAALSVGTDSAGGFSVPSLVMPQIMEALVPASSVLTAGAGILPLEDGAKTFTQVILDTIPTAAWRAEAGAVSESDPAFRGVVMTPRSLSFRFKVSRELLADGVGIEDALRVAIAQAFAKELDRVALRGSGSAPEPRGILNTTNVGAVTNGAAGATQSSQRWTKLLEAVSTILAADAPLPTAAIMAPRSLVGYSALADSTNQPLQRPDLLRDMRFLATSQIPVNLTVSTSTDCTEVFLGDFTKVLFAMRESVSIGVLRELYAENGQIGFVGHVRADVAVLYPKAFAVVTGIRAG
ncbi:MAG: phage major capsid protein [Burkholderiaceae bacterium]|jgi:HK97 family phage major capsid protein|nr:phage major capsid protein [Burkholderiaceae bacterium]